MQDGKVPATLWDRIRDLQCPHDVREDIQEGQTSASWDIPYRSPHGAPKVAWVTYQTQSEDPNAPFLLTVNSLEYGFAFAPDGGIARARLMGRYAIADADKQEIWDQFRRACTRDSAPIVWDTLQEA